MLRPCPHCEKSIEVSQGGKTLRKPGTKNLAHRELGDAIFAQVLKLTTKQQIGAAHRRYGGEVRDILAACGSVERGLQAAQEVVAWLEAGGFNGWTLSAVAKHALRWSANRKHYLPKQTYGVVKKQQPICADADCRKPVASDGDYCAVCAAARKPLTEK